ncbi:hypothetical protein R3P38DRAFT_2482633, partial [Favolaschia claudopus]
PHSLIQILSNPGAHPSMEVATTSVPIFDDRKQNPAYGYRSLGNFSLFYPTRVVQTRIYASAIDRNWPGLPEIPVYKAALRTLRIDLSRHFILILPNFGGISIPYSSPFPIPHPDANSYPIQSGIDVAAQDLYDFNDCKLAFYTLLRMPQFVAGVSLSYVYQQAGITEVETCRAKHVNTCKDGLWGLVRNHRRLCTILSRLGLSASDVFSRTEFSAGLKITTEDVLLDLEWTQDTFRRKPRLFSRASRISKGVWKGTPPSDTELYGGWQNIVAMFGEGGFCDGTRAPRKHDLANDAEKNAASLTQTHLV